MVEVQEVGEEEGDRLILVRSRGCAQKEQGIHDRMLSKLKAHLERLESAVRKGRLVNPEKIDRRIGSILARHPGMSSWVCVRREELPAAAGETAPGNQKRAAKPSQVVHGLFYKRPRNWCGNWKACTYCAPTSPEPKRDRCGRTM